MKRVVVTGIGAITPIGNDIETIFKNIKSGNHGISKIDFFDTSDFDVHVAASVKNFEITDYIEKKEVRRTDRFCQYAVAAAIDALKDTGTDFKGIDPYRAGVIVGSGIGGMQTIEKEHTSYFAKGESRVSVFLIPMMITNIASGVIGIKTGFKGINYAPVSACSSSAHAIGEAFRNIKHGYLDMCITGGAEAALSKFAMAGFNNMKALSNSEDPDRASIPFDLERNGFVMGEGGAILILEELEHAKSRGAKIYCEIIGYGATGDAHHITSPDSSGEGAAKSMTLAMEEGNVPIDEDIYINAHGTSTPLNDKIETLAIKKALGLDRSKRTLISSTKSITGHLLGAAAGIEAIITALALKEGFIPGTVGFKVSDSDCDLNYLTDGGIYKDIKYAISNSLGFGGHNVTICLKKY